MKQKHTRARKARRRSAYAIVGNTTAQSALRASKREYLHKPKPKTFGMQVIRIQRIFLKRDRFGAPIYRNVAHARTETTPIT